MFLGRFVTLELLHPKALKSDSERILTRIPGLVQALQRQQPTSANRTTVFVNGIPLPLSSNE